MDIITAQDLCFNFEYENQSDVGQPVMVLSDINLNIKKGEFVALLGHNGSGKSTLAKQFNALLLPTGGHVIVDRKDTADQNNRFEIRRTVGMVLQNPDNQLVSTIVEEDVAFGPENLGIEPTEIRRRVEQALKTVDMLDYREHAPHKLSGGQKQRVAIAGILAMQPECLVLDEPTAMLDPQGRREVLETISKLNSERGMTIILITHNMDEAVHADRVVVLGNGKIIMQGTPREVFLNAEKLREVGLDVPQPAELCDLLRKQGISLPDDILTDEECADAISQILRRNICR